MKSVIKRLLESKNTLHPWIFDIEDESKDAYMLLEDITQIVLEVIKSYDASIVLDDYGLDGKGSPKSAIRTIIFRGEIYRFDKKSSEPIPLKSKEIDMIKSKLRDMLTLPSEDENYEYTVTVEFVDTQLSIKLRRDRKVEW